MSTFANLPAKERELFFRQYQEKRGVDPVIAEKDFWVCWLLGRIFEQPQLEDACVFKEGTSLSKVFGAIDRFSEDIDLAIIPASLGWQESDLDLVAARTGTGCAQPPRFIGAGASPQIPLLLLQLGQLCYSGTRIATTCAAGGTA